MEKKLKLEKIEPLLGGWWRYLKPIFEDERMYNLFAEIAEINKKEITTPKNSQMFKFLELCPPENLKLIIIGMDSYSSKYSNGELQATGISLDCSNSPNGKLQPSLESFYEGIENDLGVKITKDKSLVNIAKQGVLLGNRALLCKLNKTGSLMGKFDFFWEYFFNNVITSYFPGVPVILLGKEAKELKKYIFNLNNPVFELIHPSFSARNRMTWDTKKTFSKVNKMIELNNGKEFCINWSGKISKIEEETVPF